MKIFDCLIYSDEDFLLDLRLNILDKYVDKFVVVESKYTHSGKIKNNNFKIQNFTKFKDKINYIYVENEPEDLKNIENSDNQDKTNQKKIFNSLLRDNFQRNKILDGIVTAKSDDLILISDLDEIPNLESINIKQINNKLIFFKQKMFYYKLNLCYEKLGWFGTRCCQKKFLKSPQWLRNTKSKKYPFWRIDTFFSDKKYANIHVVENGGWHFTQMKTAEDIYKKLNTFAHHVDFKESGLNFKDIEKAFKEKRVLYDHFTDKTNQLSKWSGKNKLEKISLNLLPEYIKVNKEKLKQWLD